jgi:AcrR family transcriptional regulator
VPRSGRRPGVPATRGRILAAARASFEEHGFDNASIRDVARRAKVDPALVHHYFGTKQRLFVAAMELPFDPTVEVPRLSAGDPERLGERLATFVLDVWEDPKIRPSVVGLIRSAASDPVAARMLRELIVNGPLQAIAAIAGGPDAELRAELAGSQLIGLMLARHVLAVEPIASADRETLIALLGPTLQAYLVGSGGSASTKPAESIQGRSP